MNKILYETEINLIKKILNDKNFDDIKKYMDKLQWKDKSYKEKFDIGKVKSGSNFI